MSFRANLTNNHSVRRDIQFVKGCPPKEIGFFGLRA
jgi:hypothetical protein